MNQIVLFLVLVVCVAGSLASHDNSSNSSRRSTSPRACVEGTISCSADCKDVVVCSGGVSIPIKQCSGILPYCNPKNLATCIAVDTCEPVIDLDFTCNDIGYFPDPFDCTKYHICLAPAQVSEPTSCRSGVAYDPAQFTCTKSLTDRVCLEKPIPPCDFLFQRGPQEENPNIYYICLDDGSGNLVPSLYKCPTNEVYQFDRCVNVAATTTTTSATTTTPTTTTRPTTTTTQGVSTTTKFPCPGSGHYPDPRDCRSFYVCSDDLQPYHRTCAEGYYYDVIFKTCQPGACSRWLFNIA